MKLSVNLAMAAGLVLTVVSASAAETRWTAGMTTGRPEFKSMGPLAFGPDGILFIGDSRAATLTAIATGDVQSTGEPKALRVEAVNRVLAGLLGTTMGDLLIDDMAVNPRSRSVYLAVSRGRGPDATPVLARVTPEGQTEVVSLERVAFSRVELPNPPEDRPPPEGQRRSNPRLESITDLAYLNGRVIIAGLSNEEFASTLRSVAFPFDAISKGASVEIYHGAHGQFETRAPVRTFVPLTAGSEQRLLAAYTCTPLVEFSIDEIQPGAKVRGTTIAELGNRNRPIDMIVYQKGGQDHLLLANSSRGVMKITTQGIGKTEGIVAPVRDGGTQGLPFETLSDWTGVDQLDRLDAEHAVVVRRGDQGAIHLESRVLP